ncbi:terminase small subunit [Uliginosibacterium gangwonense]|uniref:terminase small subunit n=1 Tax=Uliginosibacterium gangwonense TaxID=392736 RepID=UPI00036038F7|nr:terminase small subunit [Uliginosibacterium gangwonense]
MAASKSRQSKRSVLTEKQEAFTEAVLDGQTLSQAALAAGYSASTHGHAVARAPDVAKALAEARTELSSAAQIRRLDVLEGFMDAINLARLAGDPGAMIKGWSEVGKMLGFYAPEVKKVELTTSQGRLRSKFEVMSDAELLAIACGEGDGMIIDVEPPIEH